jgi:hypothetical protein
VLRMKWCSVRAKCGTAIYFANSNNLRSHWLAPNLANTSRECRGNLYLVLAFLPWDHGYALFVVLTYGLYAITAAWTMCVPFGA